jgi:Nucleotidyltransferase
VLLDALDALAPFRDAVILVGAQAIYQHTGDIGLAVAPYTTDADLALNPELLLPDPKLDVSLKAAGFAPSPGQVGIWVQTTGGTVDLLVPEALGGAGRRGARLHPHGNQTARKARGLEAALADNSPMTIEALDAADRRRTEVAVAGPSALLVAKLHKLAERQHVP